MHQPRNIMKLIRGAAAGFGGVALAVAVSAGGAPDAHAESNTFKIGSILSVTGRAAFLGEDMKNGMQLAIDEINAAGGIKGKKIEWFFYDAESQTTNAVNSTKRLIDRDKVDIIVGGGNMSGIALAMVPMVERGSVPFMATEGSMKIVNPVEERKWTFKSTVDDDQVIHRLADYMEKNGLKKVALLHSTTGFGQSAVEQMERVGKGERGLDVVYESFNPGDTDLTAQLTNIKQSGADVILCWTVTPVGVVFLKQAHQMGLDDRVLMHSYGFVSQRYMELAGDAAEGLLLLSVKFPVGADLPDDDPVRANIRTLTKSYEQKFGSEPNQFVAQTYDAIYLAKLGLEAGGGDPAAVRDALQNISGFEGASGTFNFGAESHSGLSKSDIVIITWKDGQFRLHDYR